MPAVTLQTDPDGNGLLDSIGIISDWNPHDGLDRQIPTRTSGSPSPATTLFKQGADRGLAPVPFADNVNRLTFAYFNPGRRRRCSTRW